MNKADVIKFLEQLQKYSCYTGDSGPFASQIDWEEDNDGNWIKAEDILSLINELKKDENSRTDNATTS